MTKNFSITSATRLGLGFLVLLGTLSAKAQSEDKLNEAKPSDAKSTEQSGAIKTSKVYFITPKDGDTVKPNFTAKFGVEGIRLSPAGKIEPGTGHFHVIIDAPATKEGEVVPADEKHLHFGKAQTEAKLSLKPGPHSLTLQFADGAHRAYSHMLTQTIQVIVK